MALGLMAGTTMFAQEDAGNKMWLGGTAGFASGGHSDKGDNTNDYSTMRYNFGPSFGYMLDDKMAVGINLLFSGSSQTDNDAIESKTSTSGYNIQPFFRYYFAGADKFKFYGDLRVGFGGGNTKTEDNTGTSNERKNSTFDVGAYAGAQYWFNPNWSMAADLGVLGYQSMTDFKGQTNNNGESMEEVDSEFGLGGNFATLTFSMFYHF